MKTESSPTQPTTNLSRREFLKQGSRTAAASALAAVAIPHVHAAGTNAIRLALIGSGSRGSGAAANALESVNGPAKLVVMADLFEDRLKRSHKALHDKFGDSVDVPPDRQFIGFDAYKKAIDCLRPGDVAMLTGYTGFRPMQLEYAVEKGINVFMEKSFATDPPAVRRVIAAGEAADKKNVKIAAGLQCRHSRNRQELIKRIRDGEMGQIQLIRSYRMEGGGWLRPRPKEAKDPKELLWQIRNRTNFYWVSGGYWVEMNIHQVDELCWLKGEYPVCVHGVGGRAANSKDCGQNLDSFSMEWTFADGTKAYHVARYIPKCFYGFDTFVHGTKCAAQFSGPIHAGIVHTYKDQRCAPDNIAWEAEKEPITPWQAEWDDFLDAIRNNKPHNEAKRAAMSNLAGIMGRAAVHMGRTITWDEAMKSDFQFFPDMNNITEESEPPVKADAEGHYPAPIPGQWSEI